jgi:hypothetical protein
MKKKQRRALALGATILSMATAFGALMAFLDSYGQTDQARPAQAIVVLGSHVISAAKPVPACALVRFMRLRYTDVV